MKKCRLICAVFLLLLFSGTSRLSAQAVAPSGAPKASVVAFTEEAITLETPTGALYGTLTLPKSNSPHPIVLIIAGSGPTDRNGNSVAISGANNSYKMLAEGLTEQGIASLRYDKRGIGESAKAMVLESDLRLDTYVDDAVLWGKKLRGDRRFSTLTIIGHSEGSLIGMIAAQKLEADAYVSLAGAGRPIDQIILEQVKPQLPPDLFKATQDALTTLAAGKTLESFPPQLAMLFRPSVQPFMISWIRFDPAKEIAKLSVPVLVIQGTTDLQVSVNEAKLLAAAKPDAKLLLVDGMNHVLKAAPIEPGQNVKAYSDPSLPVVPAVISETAGLVKKAKRQKPAK